MFHGQSNVYVQSDLLKHQLTENTFFSSKPNEIQTRKLLTATERKIYDAVIYQGISVGNLSTNKSSIRVTYRCIKHLKGKKLVFQRRTPKAYALTEKGKKLATVLHNLQQTIEDAWLSFQQISQNNMLPIKSGDSLAKPSSVRPITSGL